MKNVTESMNPEPRGDGNIAVRFLKHVPGTSSDFERAEHIVSYDEAFRFASNLLGMLRGLADERMRNAVAGACETCGNSRMVHVEKHGRPWSEHCPDCHDRYVGAEPVYPVYPIAEASA